MDLSFMVAKFHFQTIRGPIINQSTISIRSASWPMAVLPVLLAACLLDQFLWSGALKQLMPQTPLAVSGYSLLFGLPHIIGSFISLLDREYLTHYKAPLRSTAIGALLLATITVSVFPPVIGFLFFNVLTVYHTSGQQVGISRGFITHESHAFGGWRYSVISLSCLLPVMMFLAAGEPSGSLTEYLPPLVLALSFSSTSLAAWTCWHQNHPSAMVYVVGTQMLLLLCVYFVSSGYFLFAALAPQIIHDLTAFNVYIRHDKARLSSTRSSVNWIYQLLRVTPRSLALALPFVSATIAYFLTHSVLSVVGLWLSYMHYLLEASLWRRGSLHRKYLSFSR